MRAERNSVIVWDESYMLTAEEVELLGLVGVSVTERTDDK